MYRAPARGWSVLGNSPNLAKILFVQRVGTCISGAIISLVLGLAPGRALRGAGSAAVLAGGRDGDQGGGKASGQREHPRVPRGIPHPTGRFSSPVYTDSLLEKAF